MITTDDLWNMKARELAVVAMDGTECDEVRTAARNHLRGLANSAVAQILTPLADSLSDGFEISLAGVTTVEVVKQNSISAITGLLVMIGTGSNDSSAEQIGSSTGLEIVKDHNNDQLGVRITLDRLTQMGK